MKYKFAILAVLIPAATIQSCHAKEQIVAERCVLIDVKGGAAKSLIPLLDEFAERHNLIADKSHPISPSYERRESGILVADLVYTIGMGRFGAELSLFRYDESRIASLPSAFDQFVLETLDPRYKVGRCVDVPNYQLPVVYRDR